MTADPGRPAVLKFGGTSVADAAAFERAAAIVRACRGAGCVVVVSAMSGVTDALFASVEQGSLNGLEPHFERHRAVAQALLGGATAFLTELTGARAELADLLARAAAAPPPRVAHRCATPSSPRESGSPPHCSRRCSARPGSRRAG